MAGCTEVPVHAQKHNLWLVELHGWSEVSADRGITYDWLYWRAYDWLSFRKGAQGTKPHGIIRKLIYAV